MDLGDIFVQRRGMQIETRKKKKGTRNETK